MIRFYIGKPIQSSEITLTGSERHHLLDVRRLKTGARVSLFDEAGGEYEAEIIGSNSKEVILRVIKSHNAHFAPAVKISLVQGLLKSKKWDLLLQKSMELGLNDLLPAITDHVACGANSAGRAERWHKVLISAAKQCGRNTVFPIAPPAKFTEILGQVQAPLRLLAHTGQSLPPLKSLLDREENVSQVLIMVGPEGGFSGAEIKLAIEAGVKLFSLGGYTLRAETAAIATIANLRFYYEG